MLGVWEWCVRDVGVVLGVWEWCVRSVGVVC